MTDFRRVINESGVLPLSFIDDLIIYPQVNLKLKEVLPLVRGEGGEYDF